MSEVENSGFTASGGAASLTGTQITTSTAAAAAGIYVTTDPAGQMLVSTPSNVLMTDSFDGGSVDTTNNWTTQVGGAGVVSQASGVLSVVSGVTALGYGAIFSKNAFAPKNISFDQLGFTLAFEAAPLTNLTRFWGKGIVPATPTVAVPVTDGFGFQLDNTGTFRAVVYASSTIVYSQAVTLSLDAARHVYAIVYRGDTIIWLKDNFTIPVAATPIQPNTQAMPIAIVAVAGASGPAGGQVLNCGLLALGDSGKNANQIADGLYPWRIATVKAGSTAAVATDLPLVVALHPSTVPAVTINSNTPGVGAANLGKAEDAPSASGDTGVFQLGVRRDTLTVSASATGDYNEVAVTQYGSMLVKYEERHARTYSCAVNVAAAAAATDIATITGSATTTVYVTKVIISGVQTTAGLNDILLIKRSTANTAGTSTGGTVLPHDSGDAAGTATILAYTANPTTGTPIATLRRNYLPIAGATSVVNPVVTYDFGERGRPLVLRGIAQVLAVNLNGATITGGTFDVNFEWYEQ